MVRRTVRIYVPYHDFTQSPGSIFSRKYRPLQLTHPWAPTVRAETNLTREGWVAWPSSSLILMRRQFSLHVDDVGEVAEWVLGTILSCWRCRCRASSSCVTMSRTSLFSPLCAEMSSPWRLPPSHPILSDPFPSPWDFAPPFSSQSATSPRLYSSIPPHPAPPRRNSLVPRPLLRSAAGQFLSASGPSPGLPMSIRLHASPWRGAP